MPVGEVVDFVLQACEAIADAHALGIVHRDLKPANLFCTERSDGQFFIKVLDFGISKITTPGAPGHDMTKTSALMGSPFYMSPEQMRLSKSVDARSDIWSLGVILFELLTGRPPFNAEALTELAIKVAHEPAPPLRAFLFDAPEGLERVVAKCLEKDRNNRFQTVGELVLALGEFGPRHAQISVDRVLGTLRRAGISSAALSPSEDTGETTPPSPALRGNERQTVATWVRTGVGAKRRNLLVGASLAAVLAVATVGIVFDARKGSDARAVVVAGTNSPLTMAATAPPPQPASSVSAARTDSSTTPATVSLTDLPIAPPLSAEPKPARNRAAAVRAIASTPTPTASVSLPSSPAPSAKPTYNPLEHL
jgi:serine/threonine-protein kinase